VEWASVTGVGPSSTTTVYTNAYKRTSVIVGWADQSGSHTLREDSILYPGGIGKFTTSTTAPPGGPAPAVPVITGATVAGPSEVDLTWSQPGGGTVTSYDIEYSIDPTFVSTFAAVSDVPSAARSQQVTGLSSSAYYYFRLVALGTGGTSAASGTVGPEPTPPASGPCNINSLVVTGVTSGRSTGTILQASGAMSETLYLTVNTSGDCGSHTFSVQGKDQFGRSDPGSPWPVSGGPAYSGTVNSLNQAGWSTGTHTFTVFDLGSSTRVVKAFSVCASGSASC